MATKTVAKEHTKDTFISHFRPESISGNALASRVRNEAVAALEKLELPTQRWEEWKYTRIKPLVQASYAAPSLDLPEQADSFRIPGMESDLLVFVNGRYAAELSDIRHNKGLTLKSLEKLQPSEVETFEAHFGQLIPAEHDIFTAINTAYAGEGVMVELPVNYIAEKPIHIVHLADASAAGALALQHRNLFVAHKGAEAKIVESFHSLTPGNSLRNDVTEIFVGENAGLEYFKLQLEDDAASQIDRTEVRQAAHSRFTIFTLSLSGNIVRNNLRIFLEGQHCESNLMGAYLLDGKEHVDNYTEIHHKEPHCYSNELYKGIIDDRATGVFSGKIHVYQDAQQTNAFQSNRNILLSDNANIFTKPQLEIYADDVKCSHGATTGRLDEDAMFYLRARGINERLARILLIYAFATEVTEKISIEPLRAYAADLIHNRF